MNSQRDNRGNFETWFGSPLEALAGNDDAAFIVAMVTFPLLERYVRELSRSEPNTPEFNRELLTVLPELQSESSANQFWSMYRHGLLHKVTLSKENHGLSHAKPVIEQWLNGFFWVNPELLAKRVLDTIRANFALFERGAALPAIATMNTLGTSFIGTVFPPGGDRR
jgi:hypothetical protein